jgi:hypothetical protein
MARSEKKLNASGDPAGHFTEPVALEVLTATKRSLCMAVRRSRLHFPMSGSVALGSDIDDGGRAGDTGM